MYTQPSAVSTFTSIPPGTGLSYSAGTGLGDVVEVVAEATRAKKVVEKIAETAVVPSGKPGSKEPSPSDPRIVRAESRPQRRPRIPMPRTRRAGVSTCPGDRSPATLLRGVFTFLRPE